MGGCIVRDQRRILGGVGAGNTALLLCVLLGFVCVSGGWKEGIGVKCIIYPWISNSCVVLARRMQMVSFVKFICIAVLDV